MKRFVFLAGFYILKIIRAFFSLFNEKSSCEICSGSASFDMMVCKKCYCKFLDVKLNTENICSVCGKNLVSEDDICLECRENKILKSCDKVFPIFPYILWNKKLLLRWKINGERQFSAFFAKVVYKRLCEIKEITGFFAVVPVPLELMSPKSAEPSAYASDNSFIELSSHGVTLRVTPDTSDALLSKVLGVLAHVE